MSFLSIIDESVDTLSSLKSLEDSFAAAAKLLVDILQNGGKVLVCGNGGSAADAMHFATELVCRFERKRRHLPAICLNSSGSDLTAFSNDFDFAEVFARQLEAFAKPEDLLICISTSGTSANIARALNKARKMELATIGLLGRNGGECSDLSTVELVVRSESTARIQEAHKVIIHALCDAVDEAFESSVDVAK